MIYFHARKEAKELAAKLDRIHRKERQREKNNLARRARRAASKLRHQGQGITRKAIVQLLAACSGGALRTRKIAASKAISEQRTKLRTLTGPEVETSLSPDRAA